MKYRFTILFILVTMLLLCNHAHATTMRFSTGMQGTGISALGHTDAHLGYFATASFTVWDNLSLGLSTVHQHRPWNDHTVWFGTVGGQLSYRFWKMLGFDYSIGPAWQMVKTGSSSRHTTGGLSTGIRLWADIPIYKPVHFSPFVVADLHYIGKTVYGGYGGGVALTVVVGE